MTPLRIPRGLQGLGEIIGEPEEISLLNVSDREPGRRDRGHVAYLRSLVNGVLLGEADPTALQAMMQTMTEQARAQRSLLQAHILQTPDPDRILPRMIEGLNQLVAAVETMQRFYRVEMRPEYLQEGLVQLELAVQQLEEGEESPSN